MTRSRVCWSAASTLLLITTACSDPKPPPAPVKAVAPVAIAVPQEEERAPVDQAALARELAALGAGPAAKPEQPTVASVAPAKRKVRRPLAPVEDTTASSEEYQDPTKLSDAQFQNAIGNWRGLKACIAQASAQRDEETSGALKIAFTISGQGDVVTSKVYDFSNDHARAMANCIEREARRVKFPAFTAEESITKEAKFVF